MQGRGKCRKTDEISKITGFFREYRMTCYYFKVKISFDGLRLDLPAKVMSKLEQIANRKSRGESAFQSVIIVITLQKR
jgi:hypothetical protein